MTHDEFVTYSPQSREDCYAALQAVLGLGQWWGNQKPPAFLADFKEVDHKGRKRILLSFEDCEDDDG